MGPGSSLPLWSLFLGNDQQTLLDWGAGRTSASHGLKFIIPMIKTGLREEHDLCALAQASNCTNLLSIALWFPFT